MAGSYVTPEYSADYNAGTPTRDRIVQQLHLHGLKPTHQRVRVAEILMAAPTHMTAEQILAAIRKGGERVSKATVYNTLKVLAQRGMHHVGENWPCRRKDGRAGNPNHEPARHQCRECSKFRTHALIVFNKLNKYK